MNENKNKVINYTQDFGALIALILLMAGISIASPCCASPPSTDSLPSA